MFLALKEIKRAKVRFGLLMAAIGLLVFLILTQQALQDGLLTSFVGAIERQSAPVVVYSVDGQRTLQGSIITPDVEASIEGVAGVAAAGRIGQSTFTASIDDGDQVDVAVIGYGDPDLGAPDRLSGGRLPTSVDEAVGSSVDFSIGDVVVVVPPDPSSEPVTFEVVGLADNAQIQVTATLFAPWEGYEAAVLSANPDARAVLPNAIGVRPEDGISAEALTQRINAAVDDADALTRQQAADEAPGVAQVRQSFQVILLLYGLVVPLVTGLFFLIITFQKSASLTLLRAIGGRSSALVRSLLLQVLVVMGGGIVIGVALYTPLSQLQLGTIALRFDVRAVIVWSLLLLALGLLSALASARRVLAIDPIEATTGGGGR